MVSIKILNIIKFVPFLNVLTCAFSLIVCMQKSKERNISQRMKFSIRLCVFCVIFYLPYMVLCRIGVSDWILNTFFMITVYAITLLISSLCISEQKKISNTGDQ